jgi:hypothetical protein
MELYGGIDRNSKSSVVALSDAEDHVVYRQRLANEAAGVGKPWSLPARPSRARW